MQEEIEISSQSRRGWDVYTVLFVGGLILHAVLTVKAYFDMERYAENLPRIHSSPLDQTPQNESSAIAHYSPEMQHTEHLTTERL